MKESLNTVGKFTIKDLERLSGIKAHTIRIWEKRYQLVDPQRSASNIRYYSNDDLKRILNVAMLNQAGLKISNIVSLNESEIKQRIEEHSVVNEGYKFYIDRLVFAMIDMDEEKLEATLDKAILEVGFEKTMLEVIYPFFKNVGLMWLTGTVHPGQEHCISNMVRRKLIIAIDRKKKYVGSDKKIVFFLPNGEWHELGLLFHNYIALSQGIDTYYLGQSVPLSTLKEVVNQKKPTHLAFSHLSVKDKDVLSVYIKNLSAVAKGCKVIYLDNNVSEQERDKLKVQIPKDIDDYKEMLLNSV